MFRPLWLVRRLSLHVSVEKSRGKKPVDVLAQDPLIFARFCAILEPWTKHKQSRFSPPPSVVPTLAPRSCLPALATWFRISWTKGAKGRPSTAGSANRCPVALRILNWSQWQSTTPETSPQGVTRPLEKCPNLCHIRTMNKTNLFSTQNLSDLQDFMFDTMLPADDCVDWFCDRHEVNATDEVIDFVVDAHFAFHGEW